MRLHQYCAKAERADLTAAATSQSNSEEHATSFPAEISDKGIRHYWAVINKTSIDGLPGIQDAYKSKTLFDRDIAHKEWKQEKPLYHPDDLQLQAKTPGISSWVDPRLLLAFLLGALTTGLWSNFIVGPKVKA